MARVTLIVTALVIALVAVFAGTTAAQTDTRDRTFLTFSGPVEMPGVTLPTGTYVFKLADTPSRNVVEVWDRDEKKMIGHWLFVQAERPEVSQETVVMFKETAAGATPAVHYWYYPGERIGKEFVYPKSQAVKLAARTTERVLSTEGEATPDAKITPLNEGNAANSAAAAPPESQQARAPEPQPAPAPRAEPVPPANSASTQGGAGRSNPEPAPAPRQVTRTEPLPQTASPLALSALIGVLSLAGAAGTRFLR
jgi:hypothetical protein